MSFFGTPPNKLHRKNAPVTSVQAAHAVDTTDLEQMVFAAICDCGPNGCIADDLLTKYKHYPYSSITARFAALRRKNLITCGPDTREGKSRRPQRVMREKL